MHLLMVMTPIKVDELGDAGNRGRAADFPARRPQTEAGRLYCQCNRKNRVQCGHRQGNVSVLTLIH